MPVEYAILNPDETVRAVQVYARPPTAAEIGYGDGAGSKVGKDAPGARPLVRPIRDDKPALPAGHRYVAGALTVAATEVVRAFTTELIPLPPTPGETAERSIADDPFARAMVKLLAANSVTIFGTARTAPQIIAILKGLA